MRFNYVYVCAMTLYFVSCIGCRWFTKDIESPTVEKVAQPTPQKKPLTVSSELVPAVEESLPLSEDEAIQEQPEAVEQEFQPEDPEVASFENSAEDQVLQRESVVSVLQNDPKAQEAFTDWQDAIKEEASIYESPEYKSYTDAQMRLVQEATNDPRVREAIQEIEKTQDSVLASYGLSEAQNRLKEMSEPVKQKYNLEEKQFAYQNASDEEREKRQVEFLEALTNTMQELNENEEFQSLTNKMQEVLSQAPEDTRMIDAMNDYGKVLNEVMEESGSKELQEAMSDYVARKQEQIDVAGKLDKLKSFFGSDVEDQQFYDAVAAMDQQ